MVRLNGKAVAGRNRVVAEKRTGAETRQPRTIQSLQRSLSVIIALNENAPVTLSRLVELTGLPKATVVRILHTLRKESYVELIDRGYRPLPRVRLLSSSLDRISGPNLFVQNVLNDFAQLVKWPAEFLVRDGISMVIEVSNRSVAPIGLRRFEYTRFPLFSSAAGVALLTWSKSQDREDIIRSVSANVKGDKPANMVRAARIEIAEARKRGYAMHDYEAPIEGTRAISVPVLWRDFAVGAVSLIYLREAVTEKQVETFLAPRLWEVAHEIGRQYVALGGQGRK
ncbi:MAG: IclR family transcriptional regulator [Xanthobacteraceae bacterium]